MIEEPWFNRSHHDAIYNKYENYYRLFEALLHPDGHEVLSYELKNKSFSAYELELILMLRQTFDIDRSDTDCVINSFNQLAEWFHNLDHAIADCDYLFIQAYIALICDQVRGYSIARKFKKQTQENLNNLAQFSVDMAEFYSNRSTQYDDICLPHIALEEYVEKRNHNLYELLYSLGSLSTNTKDKLISDIINTIKKDYLQQPSLDDDGFANLYEYLGYINYHGGDHFLYQTAIDELDNDIHCEVYHLSLPDMVTLLEDHIYEIVDNGDMQDIDSWKDFERGIVESHEFHQLLRAIKEEFMRGVPEYFPE
ncbi:hypothetical protein [Psychrobacter sp. 78a-MNA-CIBAN-0178]|uniref:hypothetical protein n=1 Tax=Psychrobacter sp. 78a-MNA-CIBAN-0178 TaxID=3140450 RepID=UPI0033316E4C